MKLFAWLKSGWVRLEKEWILWRTRRVLKQVDKKLVKHAKYMQALKNNQDQEK